MTKCCIDAPVSRLRCKMFYVAHMRWWSLLRKVKVVLIFSGCSSYTLAALCECPAHWFSCCHSVEVFTGDGFVNHKWRDRPQDEIRFLITKRESPQACFPILFPQSTINSSSIESLFIYVVWISRSLSLLFVLFLIGCLGTSRRERISSLTQLSFILLLFALYFWKSGKARSLNENLKF